MLFKLKIKLKIVSQYNIYVNNNKFGCSTEIWYKDNILDILDILDTKIRRSGRFSLTCSMKYWKGEKSERLAWVVKGPLATTTDMGWSNSSLSVLGGRLGN